MRDQQANQREAMTIVWPVDDLNISHANPAKVPTIVKWLTTKYHSLTATRLKSMSTSE